MQPETLPDFSHCVKALTGAFALSKKAIQVEIAVAFVVFHQFGETSIDAKRALRQVYADAGRRDCMTAGSPAYQTVVRRINRCAGLFDTFGMKRIARTLKDKHGAEAVRILVQLIEPLDIETMDDVAAHSGTPRKRASEEEQGRAQADQSGAEEEVEVVHVKTRHIDVRIPPDTPARELRLLAKKLTELAAQMEEEK